MTDTEIFTLCLGFILGCQLMLAVHLVGNYLDARRDREAAEAALTQALKQHAVRDWRDALTVRERA
jgi:hypothetical protein